VWGSGDDGQLGLGEVLHAPYPVKVEGLSRIRSIHAGAYHNIAVDEDGKVWTWGANRYGQLGNGSQEAAYVPVLLDTIRDVQEAVTGYVHSLALKRDGTVWAWGNNEYGQLGDGTQTSSPLPVQVSQVKDVISVAAGGYTSYALGKNGVVMGWGWNKYGQMGDGQANEAELLAVELFAVPYQFTPVELYVNGAHHEGIAHSLRRKGLDSQVSIQLDEQRLAYVLEGQLKPVILIRIDADSDRVVLTMEEELTRQLADSQAVLRLETALGYFEIPLQDVRIEQLRSLLAADQDAGSVSLAIKLLRDTGYYLRFLDGAASGDMPVPLTEPVRLKLEAISGDTRMELSALDHHIRRELPIPRHLSPQDVTMLAWTGNGSLAEVPAQFIEQGGVHYAATVSMSTSPHLLVRRQEWLGSKAMLSASGIWQMADTHVLGPHRMSGVWITRAELAAAIRRLLEQAKTAEAVSYASMQPLAESLAADLSRWTRWNDPLTRMEITAYVAKAMKLAGKASADRLSRIYGILTAYEKRVARDALPDSVHALADRSSEHEPSEWRNLPKAVFDRKPGVIGKIMITASFLDE
jgi:hypothetical protein